MTSVDSNFNFLCGRPHGAGPPFPPSTCVHLSLTPSPHPCGRHKWMTPNLHTHSTIHSVTLPSVSASGSHKHVFIVFYIVYPVLSYYLLYSNSGLSTDILHIIKANIHTN